MDDLSPKSPPKTGRLDRSIALGLDSYTVYTLSTADKLGHTDVPILSARLSIRHSLPLGSESDRASNTPFLIPYSFVTPQ